VQTIAKAFLQLASYLDIAQFADPDDAQAAKEVIGWCLAEASSEERRELHLLAAEEVCRLRLEDGREETLRAIEFYSQFIR
jgi:hypothetical protein